MGDFWLSCDNVGLWSWQKKYEATELCDGTGWEVEITVEDQEIATYGSNAYPGDDEFPDYSHYPKPFKKFLNAVHKLAGGLPFE